MIIIETDQPEKFAEDLPPDITVAALLRSCAKEADRQARLVADLDRTLGSALLGLGTAPDQTSITRLRAALIGDLQLADRLRQESEGLARALRLLTAAKTLSDRLEVAEVLAIVPNGALRHRLLAPG